MSDQPMDHQKIGVLGLGERSTLFYLQQLNKLHRKQSSDDSTCPLTLINTDFNRVNALLPDQIDDLKPILLDYLALFEHLEHFIVPNITLHETIDELALQGFDARRVVNPIEHGVRHLQRQGITELVAFGSLYTMNSSKFNNRFAQHNIRLVAPEPSMQTFLDDLRRAVYAHRESEAQLAQYHRLLDRALETRPVLLCCTELSVVAPAAADLFDLSRIQIEAGFRRAFTV